MGVKSGEQPWRVMILPLTGAPEQERERAAELGFTHALIRGGDTWHEDTRVSAALRTYGACDPRYRRHEMVSLLAPLYGVLPTPGAKFVPVTQDMPAGPQAHAQACPQAARNACASRFPPAALYGLKPWPPPGTHPRHLPADALWLRDATWRALAAYCAMTPGGYALAECDVRGPAREGFVTALNALIEDSQPYRGGARM